MRRSPALLVAAFVAATSAASLPGSSVVANGSTRVDADAHETGRGAMVVPVRAPLRRLAPKPERVGLVASRSYVPVPPAVATRLQDGPHRTPTSGEATCPSQRDPPAASHL